jgi:hypothetical protein
LAGTQSLQPSRIFPAGKQFTRDCLDIPATWLLQGKRDSPYLLSCIISAKCIVKGCGQIHALPVLDQLPSEPFARSPPYACQICLLSWPLKAGFFVQLCPCAAACSSGPLFGLGLLCLLTNCIKPAGQPFPLRCKPRPGLFHPGVLSSRRMQSALVGLSAVIFGATLRH